MKFYNIISTKNRGETFTKHYLDKLLKSDNNVEIVKVTGNYINEEDLIRASFIA